MSRRVCVNLGEIYFGQGPDQIETLLGSCVAITVWHPERQLGGLCHFLLPQRMSQLGSAVPEGTPDGRYGDQAVMALLEQVRRHDTNIADYTVKVFGGGNVLDLSAGNNRVGQANADFALTALRRRNIHVAAWDVAGEGYRYLRFDLASGDVWVRRGNGISQKTGQTWTAQTRPAFGVHDDKDRP